MNTRQIRGEIDVDMTTGRSRSVVFTEASWQRFLGSLSKAPATASLFIQVVGEDGYLSEEEAGIRVIRSREEPGWVRFSFWAPARFTWTARTHLAEYPRPGSPGGEGFEMGSWP